MNYEFAALLIYTEQRTGSTTIDIMRLLRKAILLIGVIVSSLVHGQNPPLRVAIEHFNPPFVKQTTNNRFYGFDIKLMENICRQLERQCQYNPMRFVDLIAAVENNVADVAISAITITVPRAQRVNFSLPYLMSRSRFMGKTEQNEQPFSLNLLRNKRIGIEEGHVFNEQILEMGVQDARIVYYRDIPSLIEALNNGRVDFLLLDNPSAVFWQHNSSGRLKALGSPLDYGFGFGIAINRENEDLLRQINEALLVYQNSREYRQNYQKYLEHLHP